MTHAITTTDPAPGDVLDERFEVIRSLGRGGAAAVFEVEHRITKQRRAMKVLHARHARSGTDLARFVREAQILAQLSGSGIPGVHDSGRLPDGSTYMILDLLEGSSLDEHLSRRGPLPVTEAVSIAEGLLRVLASAHERGVIHRDVKPSNVFVGPRGEVHLLDFGVATHLAGWTDQLGRLTQTNALVGTPAYMAPETIGREPIDIRTDLYAVGAILFRMLDGRPRFEAQGLVDLLGQIGVGGGRPLSRTDVPEALMDLIDRAMSVDVSRRPPSAAVFAAELGQALGDAPAPRDEDAPPAPSRRRSNRAAMLVSFGLLATGLLATALFAGWLLLRGEPDPAVAADVHPGPEPPRPTVPTSAPPRLTGIPDCDRHAIAYCVCHPENCGERHDPLGALLPTASLTLPEDSAEVETACIASSSALTGCVSPPPIHDTTLLARYDFGLPACAELVDAACECHPESCTEKGNPLTYWEARQQDARIGMTVDDIRAARIEYCASHAATACDR